MSVFVFLWFQTEGSSKDLDGEMVQKTKLWISKDASSFMLLQCCTGYSIWHIGTQQKRQNAGMKESLDIDQMVMYMYRYIRDSPF